MAEYYTKAIVLDRFPRGEFDEAVVLYTKDLGKIAASLKSSRKITSKLSGHLNVAKLVKLRLLKTNNYKIVDAVSYGGEATDGLIRFTDFINKMTGYDLPDLHLWKGVEYSFSNPAVFKETGAAAAKVYRRFLEILGFNPKFARCENCEKRDVSYFYPPMLIFLCSDSLNKLLINEKEAVQIQES